MQCEGDLDPMGAATRRRDDLPADAAGPVLTQAIQNVSYGSEQQQMGQYYPAGRYFSNWQDVAKTYC